MCFTMTDSTLKCSAVICIGLAWIASAQTPPSTLNPRDVEVVRLGTSEQLNMPVNVPRGWAVVIGISAYKNLPPEKNLSYPEKDAENVYSALISKEGGNIDYGNIKKLIGPEATLANIRDALEVWLPSKAKPGDRVIVFFVGHGSVDDGTKQGYLAPYDVDAAKLAETAYPMERLGKVLSENVKAGWKVLLVDACHSGQINVNSTQTEDTTLAEVSKSLRGLPQGVLTLTSSRASERSFEDKALGGGSGVFSHFLVQGWLGAADLDPKDGKVTADELVNYVRSHVSQYVQAQSDKDRQTPWESGDFADDLILGYNEQRREGLKDQLSAPTSGNIIVEVNLDDVEVSIDGQRQGMASHDKPLPIPGLPSGEHTVTGARMGYDPATVVINVVPGYTKNVSLQLLYARAIKPTAKTYFNQGEEIWNRSKAKKSDLATAAELFSKALKEDNSYSAAALELCRVQQAQDKTEDALKSCSKAVKIDSTSVEARSQWAVLLMDHGDYEEAVRQLQTAVTQDPKNPLVRSLLAEALYWADHFEDAEKEADRAIALDSSLSQGYLERADARRSQEKWDQAIADYNQSLQFQQFGSGFLRLAAYYGIGHGVTKNRSGRQTLSRSETAAANYGLCACEIGKRDYSRAITFCKRALAVDKEDTASYLSLARSYAELFSDDNRRAYLLGAKESIEAVLRINPNLDKAASLKGELNKINEILPNVH
jgi:tetratricopeptide (TPR) repeat protein